MTSQTSNLIGFLRCSKGIVKINLLVSAFDHAERYVGSDGNSFVSLNASKSHVLDVLNYVREVTAINQITHESENIEERCVLVNWMDEQGGCDIAVVTNEDGTPIIFSNKKEASDYADIELNGAWQIVTI